MRGATGVLAASSLLPASAGRRPGGPMGELSVSRAQLERGGWRVEVPAQVEERLRELGRPSSTEVIDG